MLCKVLNCSRSYRSSFEIFVLFIFLWIRTSLILGVCAVFPSPQTKQSHLIKTIHTQKKKDLQNLAYCIAENARGAESPSLKTLSGTRSGHYSEYS